MPQHSEPADRETPDRLEWRAGVLLLALLLLTLVSGLYLMFARGAFEPTQRLVLVADDSEGVTVGMDLTFSGFPIGRVSRIELAPDGRARILVDVPRADARWLRQTSVFTLTRGLVGNTNLRAYTGIPADPPLPDGAERQVLTGDAGSELPRLVAAARELVGNLTALTAAESSLARTLAHAESVAAKLDGPGGALGVAMGNPKDAAKLLDALERTQRLLARTDALVARADGVLGRADAQVFGPQGLAADARSSVQQLQAMLADARNSLQRVDGVLQEAQGTARNLRVATTDLDALRAELEASLRRIDGLVRDVNRRWPFQRDTELRLP